MITVDVSMAIFLYLGITLAALLLFWIRFEKSGVFDRKLDRKESVFTCPICSHVYVDSKGKDLTRCPQCQSLNEK